MPRLTCVAGAPDRSSRTFKGGTCLCHCYYAGYRFSEDIDFSCRPADDNLAVSVRLLAQRRAQAGSSRGRVHLTFDEPVLTTREIRAVEPPCPGLDPFHITAYSLQEVVAEKLRTLLQQQEKWRSGIRMT